MVRSSKFSSHSSEAQHTFCNGEVRFVERQVVVASERRAATERRARRTRSPQLRSMSLLLWLVVFCAGGALFDRALERVFVRDVVASLVVLFGKKKNKKRPVYTWVSSMVRVGPSRFLQVRSDPV